LFDFAGYSNLAPLIGGSVMPRLPFVTDYNIPFPYAPLAFLMFGDDGTFHFLPF